MSTQNKRLILRTETFIEAIERKSSWTGPDIYHALGVTKQRYAYWKKHDVLPIGFVSKLAATVKPSLSERDFIDTLWQCILYPLRQRTPSVDSPEEHC